jgi:hypothetical protein
MNAFNASIRLKNADVRDYEKLDQEMEAATFQHQKEKPDTSNSRVYVYKGSGTLLDVTTAAHQAAYRSGKQYSFTITRLKPVA